MKLKDPIIRLEGTNNEFVIEYSTNIKAIELPQACKNPGQTRGRRSRKTLKKNKQTANMVRLRRQKSKLA